VSVEARITVVLFMTMLRDIASQQKSYDVRAAGQCRLCAKSGHCVTWPDGCLPLFEP